MRYLVDTSAWVEYLEGGKIGRDVQEILKGENEILILPLIIAEVISKTKRNKSNVEVAYESMIKNSKVLEITPRIAKEAGLLHASKRLGLPSFSLVDALIASSANFAEATILTKDTHFKSFEKVFLLK